MMQGGADRSQQDGLGAPTTSMPLAHSTLSVRGRPGLKSRMPGDVSDLRGAVVSAGVTRPAESPHPPHPGVSAERRSRSWMVRVPPRRRVLGFAVRRQGVRGRPTIGRGATGWSPRESRDLATTRNTNGRRNKGRRRVIRVAKVSGMDHRPPRRRSAAVATQVSSGDDLSGGTRSGVRRHAQGRGRGHFPPESGDSMRCSQSAAQCMHLRSVPLMFFFANRG